MSTGQCWTLKTSKLDQTTPGPHYETQYLNSITRKVETTEEMKRGSFGTDREKQRIVPNRGLEKEYIGSESPGPTRYGDSE